MENVGSALFYLVIVLAVFLFWGDPDIHDMTMQWLQNNS